MSPDPEHAIADSVVELTPSGRGAIAVLLVMGPRAESAVRRFFRPYGRPGGRGKAQPAPALRVGVWTGTSDGDAPEEVVVRRRHDGAVEVCCHGGRAAVERIVTDLASCGLRPPEPRADWTRRAQASGIDLVAAEAAAALACAQTLRVAAILLDQYSGALLRAVSRTPGAPRFGKPDERAMSAACRLLDRLLARAHFGRRLTQPAAVVLLGRPNVGKSSLLNAIAGYTRAIVHPEPGTTRDTVTLNTAIDGWPVRVVDTAGLHNAQAETVEAAGIARAAAAAEQAELRLIVLDAGRPLTDDDRSLLARWPDAIPVANKVDLPAAWPTAQPLRTATDRPIAVSALKRTGLDALLARIAGRLVPHVPPPGAAVPFTERQIQLLRRARAALATCNCKPLLRLPHELRRRVRIR